MEQLERRLSFSGLTINSDPSFRMQARPLGTGIAPGAGKHREDFGSSGFTRSPRKSKPNKTCPASTQSTTILVDSAEDDNNIDLFAPSEPSRHSKIRIRTTTASGSKEIVEGPAGVVYKGKVLGYHPQYPPKPSKLPKFKKNKSTTPDNDGGDNASLCADTPDQPQESDAPQESLPPVSTQIYRKREKKAPTPSPHSSQPSPSSSPENVPRRLHRPTVKPPTRVLTRIYSSDDDDNPVEGRMEEEEATPTVKKERPKPRKKHPEKYTQQKFPLLNDPTFHSDQPLRVVSNLSPSRSLRSTPEATPIPSHDVEGEDKVVISEEDSDGGTSHAPQPFPLSTNFMNSTPKASKRLPEDETHNGGSERKKLKETLSNGLLQDGLLNNIGNQDPDLFFLDPNVDPSTLCPWCDQQLPTDPTPRLKSLIESVRSKSYSSPRPSNPLGLGAPLTASVVVCQRHRFESHQVPKAQAKGWPTKIDFGKVKPRVEALRSKLEALLLDKPCEVDDLIIPDEDEVKPRDTCPFWTEMMREVKSKGSRAVASSKGQFASFKALQPGYYGELGYLIIYQTIYQLFPPDATDPDSTTPLTPSDFIQRILVPEAAVHLIMEDLQSTYPSAIKTLRESVEYGVAMFPDTGGDNEEGMKAADEVMKERARVRRMQLLEEEVKIEQRDSSEMEVEFELSQFSSPPKPVKSRSKRDKVGAKSAAYASENKRDLMVIDWSNPQVLTQRGATTKHRKPTSGYRSDASNASNASVESRISTRSNKKRQISKVEGLATVPSGSQPPPSSQLPKLQMSGSSYRTKTPSDGSSDVEIISDHSTQSHTRDGPELLPKTPPRHSNSTSKRSKRCVHTESAPDTDSDDELLKSSPFNVKRHVSRGTSLTNFEPIDVDETPKVHKIGSMKLNVDPWGVVDAPKHQLNCSRSESSQDLSRLLDGDDD